MGECANKKQGLAHCKIGTLAHLVLMSDDSSLVGYGDGDVGIVVEDNALATKSALKARIDGAVNEVFFFVRNFFQKLVAFFHINMTGRTRAHAAAVVVEVNVEFLCQFQN